MGAAGGFYSCSQALCSLRLPERAQRRLCPCVSLWHRAFGAGAQRLSNLDTPGLITGSLLLSKQVLVTDCTLKPKGKVAVGKSGCFYLKEEKGQVMGSTRQGAEL